MQDRDGRPVSRLPGVVPRRRRLQQFRELTQGRGHGESLWTVRVHEPPRDAEQPGDHGSSPGHHDHRVQRENASAARVGQVAPEGGGERAQHGD
ncbi:hypothetical protein ACGFSB_36995 [Streptomyces sp. NPDC048441]|uniref:hypothetical protein n=1 Tax=Streptomyces sp. NPDC048441 TaxID=3365552 RepID=UPI0037137CC8